MSFGSSSISATLALVGGAAGCPSAGRRLVSGIGVAAPWLVANRFTTFSGRFCTGINRIKQEFPIGNRRGSGNLYATVLPCCDKRHLNLFYTAVSSRLGCQHMPDTSAVGHQYGGCPTEPAQFIAPKRRSV